MKYEDAVMLISRPKLERSQVFDVLKFATRAFDSEVAIQARDIVLRLLDRADDLPEDILSTIRDVAAGLGYYPYLLPLPDCGTNALAIEFHRSDVLPELVLHSEQLRIATLLLAGKSVVLSAPTSFGKSLLIEEVVGSKRFRNIVIIQPTLALIDETRMKMNKYSDYYKIIFSTGQKASANNIFILTPERVVEFPELPAIDFFVIDEFYKLSLDRDDDRAAVLNQAFYQLLRKTRHFYLLGPLIGSIPPDFPFDYDCTFVRTTFATVASNRHKVPSTPKTRFPKLVQLLASLTDPTLVYCQAPSAAEKYALGFIEGAASSLPLTSAHDSVINWIKENIHPDWSLTQCLKRGVGFHHGRLPRYLARYLVQAFNQGTIKYLFCTSTLIEGVNTSAKNVVIFDGNKGRDKTHHNKPLDFFDFANIAGRSGRMGRHFVGNVYVFPDEPAAGDLAVDIPWYTQTNAPDEILVQLSEEDLTPQSRERIDQYRHHHILDFELICKNSNMSPEGQIRLAEYIYDHRYELHPMLYWGSPYPTSSQLYTACNLIWDFLKPRGEAGVYSGNQLAFVVNRYRTEKSAQKIIRDIMRNDPRCTVNNAVSECMNQIRVWFEFRFPKLLSTLDSVQRAVFEKVGLPAGDYRFFAAEVENGFIHPNLAALREFGIPPQVAVKIQHLLGDLNDLDSVLHHIRRLDKNAIGLTPFERELLSAL